MSDTQGLRRGRGRLVAMAALTVPLVVLVAVRVAPRLDVAWENHPAHFWLVLGASLVAMSFGQGVVVAARRRHDARLLFVALAFLAGAGFLGLHALATPGVLLGPNAGFELATPIGLTLGGILVAVSSREFSPAASAAITARSSVLVAGLVAMIVAWAAVSVAELPPLAGTLSSEALDVWHVAFAVVGIAGYGTGAVGYLRLYARRGTRLTFAVAVALALLAEAILVTVFAQNWRVSWWEWHLLMVAAFVLIAMTARREWHEERFSALYLDHTLAGARDVSILFADLQGFTSYSEQTSPAEVARMLNTYFERLVPLLERAGGQVHQLIGDAIMVVFNKDGEVPDHPVRAAKAALLLQETAADVARDHPAWPRFRVGVNSGEVAAGVMGGESGHRKHDVVGDSVNLAARLESLAPVGSVVIGSTTFEQLPPGAVTRRLPPLEVKGKADPVTAYVLHSLG